jgi:hypothetical protein
VADEPAEDWVEKATEPKAAEGAVEAATMVAMVANIFHRNPSSHTQVRKNRSWTASLHRRSSCPWQNGTYLRTDSHFRCTTLEQE